MADQTLSESQLMIDAHGDALYRYALLRVRNPHVAEDLVQETFLAALQGTYRESGEAAERQFWDSLARCLERLPARAAEVFLLREMDELRTETICELMHLTPTNLGVILHRARRQLRDCLSSRYFGRSEEGTSS